MQAALTTEKHKSFTLLGGCHFYGIGVKSSHDAGPYYNKRAAEQLGALENFGIDDCSSKGICMKCDAEMVFAGPMVLRNVENLNRSLHLLVHMLVVSASLNVSPLLSNT